jgi:hypothetical protein
MRYLLLTFYTKASGKIDEVMTVTQKLKTKDWQTANVILDFLEQKVLTSRINGQESTRDWDTIVSYYYQHYPSTIERLFEENGHHLEITAPAPNTTAG